MQPHPIGQAVETGSGSSESPGHMLSSAWDSLGPEEFRGRRASEEARLLECLSWALTCRGM